MRQITRRNLSRKLLSVCLILAAIQFGISPVTAAEDIPEHSSIEQYDGPQTCLACHREEAEGMFGSVHYQWKGHTPNATNISENAGKAYLGFNTYCGSVESSRRVACWGCHVGNGKTPTGQMSTEQLNNIDCLTCHQQMYKRKPAAPFETVTMQDYLGNEHTWNLPVESEDGSFSFEPDTDSMAISLLNAARTVHLPTRETCLTCHAYAAGSDCGKRGDLGTQSADPPYWADIHMSSTGANLKCQSCHISEDHRTTGRGLDLRPNDRDVSMTCLTGGCHSSTPHDSRTRDNHTSRVACQTCHIPQFAKLRSTEIERDWYNPYWAGGLFQGQGGYKPEEIREMNVIPTYKWYDGTSRVYARGQVPETNASGELEFGMPNGSVSTPDSKITPMKEHWSESAQHDATGIVIPHSTSTYFLTGDFDKAVEEGQVWAGLTGAYTIKSVHTYQTINHGVEPEDNALECGSCHQSYNEGELLRMDLQGDLGYALKGERSSVCTQCHGTKENKPFESIHDKHVSDKHYDCEWCHSFTRPERNLNTPPGLDSDNDGTPDSTDGCPFDPAKTSPGSCGCGFADTDTDNDGTPDCQDLCPGAPDKVEPGYCGCETPETDSDSDGTPDCIDGCPNDPNKIEPGVTGCGTSDQDSDNDGVPDNLDGCPLDPDKTSPGVCGCGVADIDTDNDGTLDCNDQCPNDPDKIAPGTCGCGVSDVDSDNDGTPDCNDQCPNDPDKIAPGTCGCGVSDIDTDNDGTPDCNDLCPNDPDKIAPGTCGCGVSDVDSDNDGTPDCNDQCPNDPAKIIPGTCGCGVPDVDSDNDGTLDCNDLCPNDPDKTAPGTCGCGVADVDSDNDGVLDCQDAFPNDPKEQYDLDNDGIGDNADLDDDNDGISDVEENGGPNNGDANDDGIKDSRQPWVAFIKSNDGQQYVVLERVDKEDLLGCQTMDLPTGTEGGPGQGVLVLGLFEFSIPVATPGASVTLSMTLPEGFQAGSYWKYGKTASNPDDHWYDFSYDGTTGVTIQNQTLTLHYKDGGRGDDDLSANGLIRDPGGPGIVSETGGSSSSGSGGGGSSGGCFINELQ